ncbi:MAG TPA: sigma-70 family RNA polymerase sigma factor [Usitatibacter sp.]|jgi:RNA polymerase sigma-70 factor (ECF subfamily)|nr:sigma-70 family RNA polymerase sigma factor [Usitatibacter sp.]
MPVPDEELMQAYARGDAAAFETLYGRHKGALFGLVLRSVRTRGEAEEIFQEIWMRAIEARARYVPSAKFSTWLYTIAHRRLIDHWRARGLTLVSLDAQDDDTPVLDPPAGPSAEPHELLVATRVRDRLAAALAALPVAQREAFLLHAEGDLTVAQIAEATGTHEEAAKSRLRYALARLKEAAADD